MAGKEFVRNKIAAAFAANELDSKIVEDIAFHMTDWKEDLDELVGLYQNIETVSDSEVRRGVISFLAHAANHIAAAKKLVGLGPIEDIFEVGVLRDD